MNKEIKEYQACYYKDDDAYNEGRMTDFKSFDTPKECNDYIDKLAAEKKDGFIQLLLKSDTHWEANFAVGKEGPVHHTEPGKESHIILYADDFDTDVWESYCKLFEVSPTATEVTVYFSPKAVQAVFPEEEEPEEDSDLPTEVTVALDDLCLDCIDNEDEVEEAVEEWLKCEYGYRCFSFEWERGDDVNTLDIYNINWDTDNEEED